MVAFLILRVIPEGLGISIIKQRNNSAINVAIGNIEPSFQYCKQKDKDVSDPNYGHSYSIQSTEIIQNRYDKSNGI